MIRETTLALTFALLAAAGPALGQSAEKAELPLHLVSIEAVRFPQPVRTGPQGYDEALVLTALASRSGYDDLSPSMEPFLYIGSREVRIFEVRGYDSRQVVLTFHVPKWEGLEERAPIVLTIDHGAPLRDPEAFARRLDLPRYSREQVVDRRQ